MYRALGMNVRVLVYPRGSIFYDEKYPFSVWWNGCGIGDFLTLEEARDKAINFLLERALEARKRALETIEKADKLLNTPREELLAGKTSD